MYVFMQYQRNGISVDSEQGVFRECQPEGDQRPVSHPSTNPVQQGLILVDHFPTGCLGSICDLYILLSNYISV